MVPFPISGVSYSGSTTVSKTVSVGSIPTTPAVVKEFRLTQDCISVSHLMNSKNLLKVKSFQETLHGGYCGPASLKMVLEYWGMNKSEEEVAVVCNRDPNLGTDDMSLKKAAESYGFMVEIENNASFDSIQKWLDRKVPVIVNWFTRGRSDYGNEEVPDGHYSIVVGLDDVYIYLQDPEIGDLRKLERDDFMRVWFDFKSAYINSWEDMIIRQIIAVYPKEQ